MKTKWNGYAVNRTPQGMTEKYRCNACPSMCYLTLLVTEEPPEICTKGEVVKTDEQAQHNSLCEM